MHHTCLSDITTLTTLLLPTLRYTYTCMYIFIHVYYAYPHTQIL